MIESTLCVCVFEEKAVDRKNWHWHWHLGQKGGETREIQGSGITEFAEVTPGAIVIGTIPETSRAFLDFQQPYKLIKSL